MSPSLRDRLSSGARRGARGVRRVLRPTITVIVEARGRVADVRASIDSARGQSDRRLEIVVVLVDSSLRPAAEEALDDWRVRVCEALGADPAQARRAGAEVARGERLLFLSPRQELVSFSGALHQPPSRNVLLCDHLIDRAVWLALPDDREPSGQTSALSILLERLGEPGPVVRDHGPCRPKPFEPQVDPLPGLDDRVRFDLAVLDLAPDRAPVAAGLLARDLPPFLDAVERCDDEQWRRLQSHVADLVREAGAALADVPVEDRVLAWLACEGRRDDLISYVASRRFTPGQFETDVREGLIRAELGVAGVPDHVLAVTEGESPLRVRVERLADHGVVLWAGIQRLRAEAPLVTVLIDGGSREVSLSGDPAVTRWMGETHQHHDSGVVTVGIASVDDDEEVCVEIVDRGVRRSTWFVQDFTEVSTSSADVGRKHPDLSDDEAGPYRQHLLQRAYTAATDPVDPHLVYFQSFLGQAPTDHPGAIQAALHRAVAGLDSARPATSGDSARPADPVLGLDSARPATTRDSARPATSGDSARPASSGDSARPRTRMLWGVADSSVPVPEGAEPVQLRSRAWYDALARAAYVVTNVELEPWFVRRGGQEVLETYHGYPSKAMGLMQWHARDLTPTHVNELLRRTSGTWNTLLTPIPEMDDYYRENYGFEGRIISQGYPRDDSLVAPGHEERRARARAQLGIAEHQTAILYAPTWRDDQATDFRSATAVLHLDVEETARQLGEDYVVLLRGHRFHAVTAGGAQVLDVTAHPEINDLILACDAAVLDYSSLRFDIALAHKPMLFLVPDLEDYTVRTRGFLYPFEASAPGPLVDTTTEVIDLLRDVPALRRDWDERLASFNARYQPLSDGHAAERVVAEFFAPLLHSGSDD